MGLSGILMVPSELNGSDRKILLELVKQTTATQTTVEGIEKRLETFVTIERIKPMERLFYGLCGAVLTSVLMAGLWLVLHVK